jgi:vancomycin resistance protein YoaR
MKRFLFGAFLAVVGAALVPCIAPAHHRDTIRANTRVGPVEVGGMTVEEAERALRVWWEGAKLTPLNVIVPAGSLKMPAMKPGQLGVTLDDVASVKDLPLQASSVGGDEDVHRPVFRLNGLSMIPLEKAVQAALGADHPARARYDNGVIVREPEVIGAVLDEMALPNRVGSAILSDHTVALPITSGTKHIPDEALSQITDVVAEYSTRFPTYKRTRCSNIKLASHLIDGTVVMPGEEFSFNGVVGRRTLKAGFKVAGVYINGQHDTGVGGGICQVSTTLYNTALLSNMAIHRRSNHSLPVPYVPLGQDATVDYGNLDLVFQNTYATPIAVTSEYHPGKLIFRILGKKQPGLSVKIVRGSISWVPATTEQVTDASIPAGQKRVIKPGSSFRAVSTIRVVSIDGKVVKREPLGRSHYGGQPRIVAVGTKPIVPVVPPVVAPPIATPVSHG